MKSITNDANIIVCTVQVDRYLQANKKTAINIENKENESDFIIIENYQTLEDGTLIMETVTSHHTINRYVLN